MPDSVKRPLGQRLSKGKFSKAAVEEAGRKKAQKAQMGGKEWNLFLCLLRLVAANSLREDKEFSRVN